MQETKLCKECDEILPLSEFDKDCDGDYLDICKECEEENEPFDEQEAQDIEDYIEYNTKDN